MTWSSFALRSVVLVVVIGSPTACSNQGDTISAGSAVPTSVGRWAATTHPEPAQDEVVASTAQPHEVHQAQDAETAKALENLSSCAPEADTRRLDGCPAYQRFLELLNDPGLGRSSDTAIRARVGRTCLSGLQNENVQVRQGAALCVAAFQPWIRDTANFGSIMLDRVERETAPHVKLTLMEALHQGLDGSVVDRAVQLLRTQLEQGAGDAVARLLQGLTPSPERGSPNPAAINAAIEVLEAKEPARNPEWAAIQLIARSSKEADSPACGALTDYIEKRRPAWSLAIGYFERRASSCQAELPRVVASIVEMLAAVDRIEPKDATQALEAITHFVNAITVEAASREQIIERAKAFAKKTRSKELRAIATKLAEEAAR